MRKLGISIYPDKSDFTEMKNYIFTMSKVGCKRIFANLLMSDKTKAEIKSICAELFAYAQELGYEIIVDINPKRLKELEIDLQDLSFFKEINVDGLRLDQGFSGLEESLLTYNDEGLSIEINMSVDTHAIDNIMDYQPNIYNLRGCHNFYPHKYTALPLDFFQKTSKKFNAYKLRTAAFVCSQNKNTFGPWQVTDGLPTLEMHRYLPLHVQIKHLVALGLVDDIIISNCYPSEEEIAQLAGLSLEKPVFDVEINADVPELMRKIILDEKHFYRGDASNYLIRSTMSRVKYRGHDFPLFNPQREIKKGDLIIESSEYGHYAGELQIAKADMENTGLSNVVGRIVPEELFILDSLKLWQKFGFRLKK